MTKRIVLTASEIDAILSIAGDADEHETAKSCTESEEEARHMLGCFQTGMDKLRSMLARRNSNTERGEFSRASRVDP